MNNNLRQAEDYLESAEKSSTFDGGIFNLLKAIYFQNKELIRILNKNKGKNDI